jgi:hypothetical protein
MTNAQEQQLEPAKRRIVQGLSFVEDAVYVGLGILLASVALSLLAGALKSFASALWSRFIGDSMGSFA